MFGLLITVWKTGPMILGFAVTTMVTAQSTMPEWVGGGVGVGGAIAITFVILHKYLTDYRLQSDVHQRKDEMIERLNADVLRVEKENVELRVRLIELSEKLIEVETRLGRES